MGGEQVTLSLSTEEPDFLSQILYQISGGHTMERDASQQPFRRRNARVDEFLDSTDDLPIKSRPDEVQFNIIFFRANTSKSW